MDDNRWLWRIGWLVVLALVLFLIWWLWPPTAVPVSAVLDPAARATTIDVLANDSDVFHRQFFIKDWSNGAHGGTVALAPDGRELLYTRPKDGGITSDSFTYSIWTRHGFPSSASVVVNIPVSHPSHVDLIIVEKGPPATTVAITSDECPRGQPHTTNPSTPLPKQYGDCFAIYFSWRNVKVFSEHAGVAEAMFGEIVKQAPGKVVLINGYTDTSGEHYMQLSKERACSALRGLKLAGLKAPAYAFADGTNDPEATTSPEIKERLNRRVEITIAETAPQQSPGTVQCLK
jgi:hypothetical protein